MMKQPSLKGQSHVNTNEIFGFSFFPALFREREREVGMGEIARHNNNA